MNSSGSITFQVLFYVFGNFNDKCQRDLCFLFRPGQHFDQLFNKKKSNAFIVNFTLKVPKVISKNDSTANTCISHTIAVIFSICTTQKIRCSFWFVCVFSPNTVNTASRCQDKAHERESESRIALWWALSGLGKALDSGLFTTCLTMQAFVFFSD